MRRCRVFFILLMAVLLMGCNKEETLGKENADNNTIDSVWDLNQDGIRIGVPTGSKPDIVVSELFTEAEIMQYASTSDGLMAVKTGKIDAFCFTKSVLKHTVEQNPELFLFDEILSDNALSIGARLGEDELMAEVNAFIKEMDDSGMRAEMEERWLTYAEPVMPDIEPSKNPTRKIIIGTSFENYPTSYLDKEGNPVGFDVEYAIRLAAALDAELELQVTEWGALIPALQSERIDLIIATLGVTEERKLAMSFSDAYFSDDIMMIGKKQEGSKRDVPQSYSPEAFIGKKIGVITGSSQGEIIETYIPGAEVAYFNGDERLTALTSGKVDAILSEDVELRLYQAQIQGVRMLEPLVSQDEYGVIISKGQPELLTSMNEFLAMIKSDGTYDEMLSRWLDSAEKVVIPDIPEDDYILCNFCKEQYKLNGCSNYCIWI